MRQPDKHAMIIGHEVIVEESDTSLDVIDKVNRALLEHGLEFEDDGKEHDGFCVLTLRKLEPGAYTVL